VRSISQAKKGRSRSFTAIQKQVFTLKRLYQDPNHVTQLTRASGSDNPNFKHGRYIKNICSECQKEISPQALKCSSCAVKNEILEKFLKIVDGWEKVVTIKIFG
jgi:ribosomal protein L40E